MSVDDVELLQGTLTMMVLKALTWGPMHGYAIVRWLEQASDSALRIEDGSLYPTLYRLEERALVTSEWGTSDNNRRAKFYSLTPAGRKHLRVQLAAWHRSARVVDRVVGVSARPVLDG
ncbi:MAG TPA: PadR family transcriptional regulator [Gemmatimonadaceae bacterium]|jgi:transcriptional regulator